MPSQGVDVLISSMSVLGIIFAGLLIEVDDATARGRH